VIHLFKKNFNDNNYSPWSQVCWDEEEIARVRQAILDTLHVSFCDTTKDFDQCQLHNGVLRFITQMYRRQQVNVLEFDIPCLELHDPSTIAYILYPHAFTFKRMQVKVESAGDMKGHSWADTRGIVNANAWVAMGVDPARIQLALRKDLAYLAKEIERDQRTRSPETCGNSA
jgi:inosine-uridine nucleoside N-ribohydrolase